MRAQLRCPTTQETVVFNIEDTDGSVAENWRANIQVLCPSCGDRHPVKYKEAYMNGVLSMFSEELASPNRRRSRA